MNCALCSAVAVVAVKGTVNRLYAAALLPVNSTRHSSRTAEPAVLRVFCLVQSIHRHRGESTRDAHEKHETVPSQNNNETRRTRCVYALCVVNKYFGASK